MQDFKVINQPLQQQAASNSNKTQSAAAGESTRLPLLSYRKHKKGGTKMAKNRTFASIVRNTFFGDIHGVCYKLHLFRNEIERTKHIKTFATGACFYPNTAFGPYSSCKTSHHKMGCIKEISQP